MFPPRPTELAHSLLRAMIRPGDTVIDATAGNGHDTVFLASCVGDSGKVIAFDVLPEAIESSMRNVSASGFSARVEFHQTSHSRILEVAGPVSASVVMFNLGYLPGQDHQLTTQAGETLAALDAAAQALKPDGILSVVCYPGHPEGAMEAVHVETWCGAKSADGWRVAKYAMLGTRRPAPFLILAMKA